MTPEPYQYPLTADPYSIINVYARKRQLGLWIYIAIAGMDNFGKQLGPFADTLAVLISSSNKFNKEFGNNCAT